MGFIFDLLFLFPDLRCLLSLLHVTCQTTIYRCFLNDPFQYFVVEVVVVDNGIYHPLRTLYLFSLQHRLGVQENNNY